MNAIAKLPPPLNFDDVELTIHEKVALLKQSPLAQSLARQFKPIYRNAADLLDSIMYTIALSSTIRNTRLNAITTVIDGGGGAGLFRIYDGSRPATGGTATTLGAELTFSATSFPAASGGAMTANTITDDSSANASITATWFRVVSSAATFVMDGNVGTSGQDLNLNTTTITSGVRVAVTSMVLTDGNP